MKWILAVAIFFPFGALAQLPIPITPDWLKGDKQSDVLHATQVLLAGNNYCLLQTNVVAKSGGFKVLGFITIKSPSYVKAVSRLYAKAGVQEGHPQALANVVYETAGMNLILFSLPKVRVRADLLEFTKVPLVRTEEPAAMRTRERTRDREPRD